MGDYGKYLDRNKIILIVVIIIVIIVVVLVFRYRFVTDDDRADNKHKLWIALAVGIAVCISGYYGVDRIQNKKHQHDKHHHKEHEHKHHNEHDKHHDHKENQHHNHEGHTVADMEQGSRNEYGILDGVKERIRNSRERSDAAKVAKARGEDPALARAAIRKMQHEEKTETRARNLEARNINAKKRAALLGKPVKIIAKPGEGKASANNQ